MHVYKKCQHPKIYTLNVLFMLANLSPSAKLIDEKKKEIESLATLMCCFDKSNVYICCVVVTFSNMNYTNSTFNTTLLESKRKRCMPHNI